MATSKPHFYYVNGVIINLNEVEEFNTRVTRKGECYLIVKYKSGNTTNIPVDMETWDTEKIDPHKYMSRFLTNILDVLRAK
jgi:hypothetical protein